MDQNNFLINTLKSYTVQSEGLWLGFHKSTSVVDTADNSTPGPQKSTVATPTKTPTIVPPTITPPYPGKQTAGIPSRPTGKTPSRQTQKTNSPLPTIPHISPYTGTLVPQSVHQGMGVIF
ncbi:Hypothetical predicted protein [Mytilus galloprovincialis]|uniref:Uncharacterized protein n=1 Tax=Mytilus galloprovincialis TaxID=29158 RepID=A0A8B6GQC4_MYTGA|nr:Hypothetical predicted protein [Mytilus galloprovincialis]